MGCARASRNGRQVQDLRYARETHCLSGEAADSRGLAASESNSETKIASALPDATAKFTPAPSGAAPSGSGLPAVTRTLPVTLGISASPVLR